MVKKIVIGLMLVFGLAACSPSDKSIMNRVVKVVSPKGSCTGEQIKAPSGKNYVLTAAHCAGLAYRGIMQLIDNAGTVHYSRVIAEDDKSDLLLLEGLQGVKGLEIGDSDAVGTAVRSFTHGAGHPTYKTEGIIVAHQYIEVLLGQIESLEEEALCAAHAKSYVTEFFESKLCILGEVTSVTTAFIVPGSSGGPVVNNQGQLVGVVSAGGGGFGYLVTLSDIQNFLSGR